jgi:magnesium chelatase family protein
MLARRLATILPPLTLPEALEVTKLYSISGSLPAETALVSRRPFRSPQHAISDAGLIGGSVPRPARSRSLITAPACFPLEHPAAP